MQRADVTLFRQGGWEPPAPDEERYTCTVEDLAALPSLLRPGGNRSKLIDMVANWGSFGGCHA
jgi:hypothetical protein